MQEFYVYIMTNYKHNVFYIGVTNDLIRRVYEHKNKLLKGFTDKYKINKLVYYENTGDIVSAIQKEKQLKNWHRVWKLNLIKSKNPDFIDLSENNYQFPIDPEINSG